MKADDDTTATPVEAIVSVPLSFGSLFAGIGGFDLGFERAGMVCKWQVEIDDYANQVLAKHWPNAHRERDVRKVGAHNLEAVDVICGGFPCQDISYAGLGAGLDGERSGLFFEAVRVVRELRPRFVVLENVAALLTRGMDRVLGTLAEIGYDVEWHCIPAAAVGAPHIRDRVFVLGYANNCKHDKPESKNRPANIGATQRWPKLRAGGPGQDVANTNGERSLRTAGDATEQGGNKQNNGIPERNGSGQEGREHQWSVEPDVGRVADVVPNRVDRLKGLGNAVVPQVAEWIGRRIVEAAGRTPAMCGDSARQDAGDWSH